MSPPPLTIRRATAADAAVLAEHRTQMFLDMGSVGAAPAVELQLASEAYFRAAVPDGEYVAWLVVSALVPGGLGLSGLTTAWVLLALLAAPLAVPPLKTLFTKTGVALNDALAGTAKLQMIYGVLFALGLSR